MLVFGSCRELAMSMFLSRTRQVQTVARGFSLIEILVSMTILAVGILGILGGFSLGARVGARTQRIQEAAAIAERELKLASVSLPDGLQAATGSQGLYKWELKFINLREALVRATVEVGWHERGNPERFTMSQIILLPPQNTE